MRKRTVILLCMGAMASSLFGCGISNKNNYPSNVETKGASYIQETKTNSNENVVQSDESIESKSTDSESDENETEMSIDIKDLDLMIAPPKDFLEYRHWLGADVSMLGIDKGSLKRQTGWIDIGDCKAMDCQGKAKIKYNIETDEIEKVWFMADDVSVDFTDNDKLTMIEDIFGTNKEIDDYSVICSGCARYQLEMPKKDAILCIIGWNEKNAVKHQYTKNSKGDFVREPAIGMTDKEVSESTWGKPVEIKESGKGKEIWVYKYGGKDDGIYISFKNGIAQKVEEYEFHNKATKDKIEDDVPDYDYIEPEKKEPAIGMTAKEVEASTWGKPKDINKTTYSWGVKEQWVYSNYRYIYLEDGVVTAIQE